MTSNEERFRMLRSNLSPLKMAVITKANQNTELFVRNREYGFSDTDTLSMLVCSNKSSILAVWVDDSEPDLCGMLAIKGKVPHQDLDAVDLDEIDAVHCSCIEEALAIQRVFGAERQ